MNTLTEDQRMVYVYSFEHVSILEHEGHNYLVEWYQDGEVLGDDELWGTIIIDLNENRYIHWCDYLETDTEVKRVIDSANTMENRWYWTKYKDTDNLEFIFNETNLKYFKDKYTKKEQD